MNNDCKDSAGGFQRPALRSPLYIAIAAAACLLANNWALAGPGGGKVTGGKGSIARAGATTNVHQQTERMSVQWQSFDLGRKETVNFLQPGSSSLVLNHIMQNGPSKIDGRINANGHVLLINPRGVIFGENSVINVGALTASTLWMQKDDFLNGDMVLRALDTEKGVVINSGLINAASGGVTLLGEGVSNEGLITAELGYVNLASGREAYLTFDEEGFLGVKVSADVVENLLGEQSSVSNSGEINAAGGKVVLQASVSSGLFDSAVNNSGIIAATGFDDVPGGSVHLLGDTVAVTGSAQISADGPAGGGEILVGGGFQGKDPQLTNSQITYVSGEASLNADATVDGDGGEIIVWADNTTRFHGEISARGGADGGDGGFVEVSGKQYLDYAGSVDTTAAVGATGMLLLDPVDILIKAGSGDGDGSDPADGAISFAGGDVAGTVMSADTGPTVIYESELEGIAATTSITLQATNDITVEDLTAGDGDGALNLQQTAMNSVTFQADADGIEGGDFIMDGLGNSIITKGGGVSISGANITVGNIDAGSGDITLNATSDITAAGTYTGTDGNFIFGQGGSGTLDLTVAAFELTTASATGGDGGSDTLVNDGMGITLTGPGTFQTDSQMVNVDGVEIVLDTGNLTGTEDPEAFAFVGGNGIDLNTSDVVPAVIISFDGVDTLNGGGDGDTLNNNMAGVTLSDNGFIAGDPVVGVTVNEIKTVTATGNLTGTDDPETFVFVGDNGINLNTADVDPAVIISFDGVDILNGGGGDTIDALSAGVTLLDSSFTIDRSSIQIENISSVDNVATLTGHSESENYTLTGTTATVDTQDGSSFKNVLALNGGGGDDTLNNSKAGVTLADNGFIAGDPVDGVTVIDIETVTDTGNLTGTDAPEAFAFVGGNGIDLNTSDVVPAVIISFDGVDTLNGGGGGDTLNNNMAGVTLSDNGFIAGDPVDGVTVIDIETVTATGNLTGTDDPETFVFVGDNGINLNTADVDPAVIISFDGVDILNGGGGDTIDALSAGVTLLDSSFTIDRSSIQIENISSVDNVATLTGHSESENYTLTGTTATVDTQDGSSFKNVLALNGGGGDDTLNNSKAGVTLADNGFIAGDPVDGVTVIDIETVTDTGNLTGTDAPEAFAFVGGNGIDLNTSDVVPAVIISFDGVDTLNGGGGGDTLNNNMAGVTLSDNGFIAGDPVDGVTVIDIETVTATGNLTGTDDPETFVFVGDNGINLNTADVDPAVIISFDGVDILNGGGGDTIDALSAGVTLLDSSFTIDRSSIQIENISSVDNVATLTGHSESENYTLTGTTATVDTQDGSSFKNVLTLNGGGGDDTLNNSKAGVTLADNGFIAGDPVDGVTVIDIETVTDTGNLTGTDAPEAFAFVGGNGIDLNTSDVVPAVIISFDGVDTLNGGGGGDTLNNNMAGVTLSDNGFIAGDPVVGVTVNEIKTVTATGNLTGTDDPETFKLLDDAGIDASLLPDTTFFNVSLLNGAGGDDTLENDGVGITLTGPGTFKTVNQMINVEGVELVLETGELTGTDDPETFELLDNAGIVASPLPDTTFFNVSLLNGAGGDDTLVNDGVGITRTGPGTFQTDSQLVVVTSVERVEQTGSLTGTDDPETFKLLDNAGIVALPLPDTTFFNVSRLNGAGGDDTLVNDGVGITLTGSDTFQTDSQPVVVTSVEKVEQTGSLTGTDDPENFELLDDAGIVASPLPDTTFFNVSLLNGAGGDDTLENDGVGITLTGPGTFKTVSQMINIEQVELVLETGKLTGTTGPETFALFQDGDDVGINVTSPEPVISFINVTGLNGGGGPDDINANKSGVRLEESGFFVGDFEFLIENIFTVNNVGTLTGDDVPEKYKLTGTTATVDTQNAFGTSFLGVNKLLGGAGFDTLNNMNAGVTLLGNGFKTGGGVTVSQIESVLSTGNLTGSAANEVFTLTGGEVSVVPTGESTSFSDVNNLDGGPGDDTLNGASEYLLTAENAGQTGGRQFSGMENLRGTQGNDTFSSAGGSLTGTIDGLGQSGGEGDRLIGFANYALDSTGPDTADGTVFIDIESLTGTSANDDVLAGVNVGVLTELDGGTANEYIFHAIENIVGTSQSDSFTRSAGSLSGSIDGGDGDDILDGFSTFVLTALNMGTADDTRFSAIENLRGTAGNDSFRKANSNGRLTGLIQGGDEIPNSVGDRLLDFTEYQILGAGTGIADGTAYQGIESISATGNGNLLGSAEDNEFVLTGNNSGTIDGIAFSGFTNLAGLGGNDVFRLEDGGNLDGSINGGGGEQDLLTGFSLYELTGQDSGTANDIVFSAIENLQGTSGNDTFVNGGGNLTGVLNGLGQVAGTEGDQLIDFSRYDLGPQELHTANGVRFRGIESLTGTSGGDDLLTGGSAFVISGTNSGTVNGSMSFRKIENLEGTAGADSFAINSGSVAMLNGLGGDDTFVLNGGVVKGLVLGGDGFDEITGANHYVLTGDNKGTASQQNADGTSQNSSRFEQVEGLVGTDGSDTFDLAGYTLSGRIDGLRDPETDGANGVTDQVKIVQDQDSATDIGFELTGDGKGDIRFGAVDGSFPDAGIEQFQLQYAGIEDFILTLEQDLNIRGIGTISSSADIDIKGSLNMYGPAQSDPPLILAAGQDINIREDLSLLGQSKIVLSNDEDVLSIAGNVSLDTAGGAEIDGFVRVNITEEPIIQVEIEEITSLSIFSEIDIFASGRSSVASSASERLGSEDDFIEALRVATP